MKDERGIQGHSKHKPWHRREERGPVALLFHVDSEYREGIICALEKCPTRPSSHALASLAWYPKAFVFLRALFFLLFLLLSTQVRKALMQCAAQLKHHIARREAEKDARNRRKNLTK
jgi:hypothetical protein